MKFPVYLHFGPWAVQAHLFFELLAYAAAYRVYKILRDVYGDHVDDGLRWWVIAAAAVGGLLGGRILGLLENPQNLVGHWGDPQVWLGGGKTIVGALLGGLIAVELAKKLLGVSRRTGDLFAVPLCVGIAIGRIGCFLEGMDDHTYGVATTLPWGVDFGDGVARHPTQIYEIIFVVILGALLFRWMRRPHVEGDIFKGFMVSYLAFRFAIEFLKPDPRVLLGLSSIQWACVVGLLYYARDVARWLRSSSVEASREFAIPSQSDLAGRQ